MIHRVKRYNMFMCGHLFVTCLRELYIRHKSYRGTQMFSYFSKLHELQGISLKLKQNFRGTND